MKTINIAVSIYKLDELSKDSKNIAITDHRNFLIDAYQDDDFDTSFNMTRSKYERQLRRVDVIETIEANEYYFYSNGELARVVQYCGAHPRAGETIFTHDNIEYKIEG